MARTIIFSNSYLSEINGNKELNQKILDCLAMHKKASKGNQLSNVGGYQTKPINDEEIVKPILTNAVNLITKHLKMKGQRKMSLHNLWINENGYKDFNTVHTHAGANFSGVYYAKVPQNSGALVFQNSDSSISFLENHLHFHNTDNFTEFKVDPKENMMIVFQSNMLHYVRPNMSNENRVSVAFNIGINYG